MDSDADPVYEAAQVVVPAALPPLLAALSREVLRTRLTSEDDIIAFCATCVGLTPSRAPHSHGARKIHRATLVSAVNNQRCATHPPNPPPRSHFAKLAASKAGPPAAAAVSSPSSGPALPPAAARG